MRLMPEPFSRSGAQPHGVAVRFVDTGCRRAAAAFRHRTASSPVTPGHGSGSLLNSSRPQSQRRVQVSAQGSRHAPGCTSGSTTFHNTPDAFFSARRQAGPAPRRQAHARTPAYPHRPSRPRRLPCAARRSLERRSACRHRPSSTARARANEPPQRLYLWAAHAPSRACARPPRRPAGSLPRPRALRPRLRERAASRAEAARLGAARERRPSEAPTAAAGPCAQTCIHDRSCRWAGRFLRTDGPAGGAGARARPPLLVRVPREHALVCARACVPGMKTESVCV